MCCQSGKGEGDREGRAGGGRPGGRQTRGGRAQEIQRPVAASNQPSMRNQPEPREGPPRENRAGPTLQFLIMNDFGQKMQILQLYRHGIMSDFTNFELYYEWIVSRNPGNG